MPALTVPGWDVRAPTVFARDAPAAERRPGVADWLARTFTGVAPDPMTLVVQFPPAYEAEAGELLQYVRGVRDELRNRNMGRVVLVFATEDEPTRDAIRSFAETYDAPIYLAPSADQVDEAVPAISITPAQRLALQSLATLGPSTASQVAGLTGGSPVSVGNTLSELHDEGLLLRQEGAGRRGHTYYPPAIVETTPSDAPLTTTMELPDDLTIEIAGIANLAGKQPGELVAQAWRAFLNEHQDELGARYQEIAGAMRSGDRGTLVETLTQRAAARARMTRPEE